MKKSLETNWGKISTLISLKHLSPLNKDEENIELGPAVLETVWIQN